MATAPIPDTLLSLDRGQPHPQFCDRLADVVDRTHPFRIADRSATLLCLTSNQMN